MPGGTYDPELIDQSLIPTSAYYPAFDVTDLVQEWALGAGDNFGVLLVNGSVVTTGIKASEYSEYGRPYLTITYSVPSDVPGSDDAPVVGWQLLPAYPNPASPSTTLRFGVDQPQDVQLCIYSIDGRRVATLVNGPLGAGTHQAT